MQFEVEARKFRADYVRKKWKRRNFSCVLFECHASVKIDRFSLTTSSERLPVLVAALNCWLFFRGDDENFPSAHSMHSHSRAPDDFPPKVDGGVQIPWHVAASSTAFDFSGRNLWMRKNNSWNHLRAAPLDILQKKIFSRLADGCRASRKAANQNRSWSRLKKRHDCHRLLQRTQQQAENKEAKRFI